MATTISLSKRMNGIDFGNKITCTLGEHAGFIEIGKKIFRFQLFENPLHFDIDKFRITEPVVTFARPDCSNSARPFVDVLKEMTMDGPIVLVIQISGRQFFLRSGKEHQLLELIQFILIGNIRLVA